MAKERVVVIGGDAAGMSAASQLRRLRKDVSIVAFERGNHTSYSGCGIPYLVARLVKDHRELIARTPEEFRKELDIDVRILTEVTRIDPSGRTVDWKNLLTGETGTEPYDKLLIATGAVPVRPPVPGIGARGVFGVNTLDSGLAVRRWIEERRPRRAVVVGGGYIGLEMAEALNCHLGLDTSVIERAPQVMGTLDPDMGRMVGEALREVGMSLYLEEGLTAIRTEGDRAVAVETDRRTLEADIVLLGLGVAPNSGLAREAGLPLGVRDAIVVDEGMRTPVEGIYAAGDCVQIRNLASGRPFHVALGTTANKMGRVAGINLAGGEATFPGALGTAVCKICRYEVARTGLLEREMGDLGIDWVAASAESETRAGYYPGAGSITVKLLAERGTGRLLGGQIVGVEGAAKRIDILATALTARMTVDQLVDLDLSYAPPFSPVWDPVQTAARVLQSRMRKR